MASAVSIVDPFDHYPTIRGATGLSLDSTWLLMSTTFLNASLVTGLSGSGQALNLVGNPGFSRATARRAFIPCKKITVNFAIRFGLFNLTSTPMNFLAIVDSGLNMLFQLRILTTGELLVTNGAGVQQGSSSSETGKFLATGIRYYIQLMLDTTTGGANTLILKVNGTEWLNVSGVTFTSGTFAQLSFAAEKALGGATSYDIAIDDLITVTDEIVDTGELEIYLFGGNAEFSVEWTPLSGTNLSNIDETLADFDTTYNSSNTPGQIDLYSYPDLPFTPESIFCVSQFMGAKKISSATRTLRNVLHIDGVNYFGANQNQSTTYAWYMDHSRLNPATAAAWEPAEIDALVDGYELTV